MLTLEQTKELKKEMMWLMFNKRSSGITSMVYEPARLSTSYGLESELERKQWAIDIRYIYAKIEGFYKKPYLVVSWNYHGECIILFTD